VIELADENLSTYLVSDNMINLLQNVEGYIADKRMLQVIDRYLDLPEEDRRVFQLLRRTLRAYDLDDMERLGSIERVRLRNDVMKENELGWSVRMNGYICRYV
jgi:hypothetical protein